MDFTPYIDPELKAIAVRNDEVGLDFDAHTVVQWFRSIAAGRRGLS